jgi:Zn-dependent M28 family amino/carboxypeptidase
MRARLMTVMIAATALAASACGNATPILSEAGQRITADRILADVEVLSADSMEGRAPGTPGEDRAIAYISERYRQIGLEPVGEDYRLPVDLLGMTKDAERSSITIRGPGGALELEQDQNFTYWSTSEEPVVSLNDVPVVFVGYGVEAVEHDWDDFKGEDVSGKVLLFLNDDPQVVEDGVELFGGPIRTYYGRWTYKFEQAQKHGAVGAIVIHTDKSASYGFTVIGNTGSRQIWQRDYRVPMLAWMDSTRSEQVAAGMGTDLAGLFEMGARRDFRPVDTGFRVDGRIVTDFERVRAYNVAGMIRGSDPALAGEYIVFTAHHDHLGMDPDLPGDDKIYNGALDNALGVAAMMATAEAFAAEPQAPRRSIMFVSVTAEEGGLLGSGVFVDSPPVERSSIVANVNLDSPQPFGLTHDMAAIGIDMSTMGDALAEVIREHGLRPEGDPNPAAGSFYRSDQVSFAKAGIPAIYLQAGRDYVEDLGFDPAAFKLERYHQVSDEIAPEWNLAGLERDLRLLYEAVRRVADADEQPRWVPGHEFESAWSTLYGK